MAGMSGWLCKMSKWRREANALNWWRTLPSRSFSVILLLVKIPSELQVGRELVDVAVVKLDHFGLKHTFIVLVAESNAGGKTF